MIYICADIPLKKQETRQILKTEKEIRKRLAELEILIKDTKARLPAHSVKPPVMKDLLAYEDEFDDLMKQLADLKND
jgi:cupin superfamily acireductone dioxygenase involved in methionine salvage